MECAKLLKIYLLLRFYNNYSLFLSYSNPLSYYTYKLLIYITFFPYTFQFFILLFFIQMFYLYHFILLCNKYVLVLDKQGFNYSALIIHFIQTNIELFFLSIMIHNLFLLFNSTINYPLNHSLKAKIVQLLIGWKAIVVVT
jgi:hypothetical protein